MYEARLRQTLPQVKDAIAAATARSGRSDPIAIVAVTKGHDAEAVRAAVAAGLRDCGENRVVELESKRSAVPDAALTWHLIGHLQRNKIRRALPLFELLHSLDSLRLAEALSREAVRAERTVRALVQIKVSDEATKGGFEGAAIAEDVARLAALPRLQIEGLMTMAPWTADERVVRGTFARARQWFERCGREVPGFQARHLSMGMSNDFVVAVEEGSTMLRLGTVLFGERP